MAPVKRPHVQYECEDSDAVSIRLSMLRLDDVVFAGVWGEVLTRIYQHLGQESPFYITIMVTHANGSSGYVPDDAYNQVTYDIVTSHLKPGCAKNGIVNGFLDMLGSQ